jgi:hypothetical protein
METEYFLAYWIKKNVKIYFFQARGNLQVGLPEDKKDWVGINISSIVEF